MRRTGARAEVASGAGKCGSIPALGRSRERSRLHCGYERLIAMRGQVMKQQWPREQRGVTAIEYAIVAGIIALALVVVLGLLGAELATMFDKIVGAFG